MFLNLLMAKFSLLNIFIPGNPDLKLQKASKELPTTQKKDEIELTFLKVFSVNIIAQLMQSKYRTTATTTATTTKTITTTIKMGMEESKCVLDKKGDEYNGTKQGNI